MPLYCAAVVQMLQDGFRSAMMQLHDAFKRNESFCPISPFNVNAKHLWKNEDYMILIKRCLMIIICFTGKTSNGKWCLYSTNPDLCGHTVNCHLNSLQYLNNITKFWLNYYTRRVDNTTCQKEVDDLLCHSLAISKSSSMLLDSLRPIIYCSTARLALQQASGYLMQMFPNETNGKYQQALSNCCW